ncbi:hypothetical protein B0H63DRAFT_396710 [Podospora didyma]|uniref:DUF7025 domain-containing protein n=1 Tax=Podospora didyma TaxID=330526 RepID=A0AAE0NGR1_9PEZI|nr:hypothetical protein B0H63DRAFT_396710 [Podospora didyma]
MAKSPTEKRRFFRRTLPATQQSADHVGKETAIQDFYEGPNLVEGPNNINWVEWAVASLPVPKKLKFEGAAIQVYHRLNASNLGVNEGKKYFASSIRLQSPYIQESMAETFKKHGLDYDIKGAATSQVPHRALFHSRERIAEVADTTDNEITREHLTLLLKVIQDELADTLDLYEQYEKDQKIGHHQLWTIFPSGHVFATKPGNGLEALRAEATRYVGSACLVDCQSISFNGCQYCIKKTTLEYPFYNGRVHISKLSSFPIIDLATNISIKERLHARGLRTTRPTKEDVERNREVVMEDKENLLIMSPMLGCYNLLESTWHGSGLISVDDLYTPKFQSSAFEKLVFDEKKKSIVRSLTGTILESGVKFHDLISGKVADLFERPLLRIGSMKRDLSENENQSSDLQQNIRNATEWRGLVLFDAFVRHIEYFKGIVFLTTNLTGPIDAAVRSRAQIHLTFSSLAPPMRMRVWRNFVEDVSKQLSALSDADITELAKWEMNGREIKNTINLAVAWCQNNGLPLSLDAVEDLIALVSPFATKKSENSSELLLGNGVAAAVNGAKTTSATEGLEESLLDLEL